MNNMSNLADTLTASGGVESVGFLNDLVAQLWPNITVAAAQIAKDVVDPILASTLPGPLSSIHFVKLDLGQAPFKFANIDVHKTTKEGIKLDVDIIWEGQCDIELDGNHVPKIGIEKVHLKGRLSVLLGPLLNVVPLVGAAQLAFINTPHLELDFTDAANIADSFLIKKTVRSTILGIVEGLLVLPNRMLIKLDAQNDYFKTFQPHLGFVRITIARATGIVQPKKEKTGVSKLLSKVSNIVKDVPDCYVKVKLGAEKEWKSATQKNNTEPAWNETHDFLVSDFDQLISLDIQDDDLAGDDDIGLAETTVKSILLNNGSQELPLTHKGQETGAKLVVHAQFYNFVNDVNSLSTQTEGQTQDSITGIATILIGSVSNLQGNRDELKPSVQVTWGASKYQTAVKTYTPGTDIFNPAYDQAFRIPLTAELLASQAPFKITLLNAKDESGSVEIPFQDVVSAPGLVKEESFDVGNGVSVRASFSVHGVQLAQ